MLYVLNFLAKLDLGGVVFVGYVFIISCVEWSTHLADVKNISNGAFQFIYAAELMFVILLVMLQVFLTAGFKFNFVVTLMEC